MVYTCLPTPDPFPPSDQVKDNNLQVRLIDRLLGSGDARNRELQGLAGVVAVVSPDSIGNPGSELQHDQALQSEAEWFEAKTHALNREDQVSLVAMLRRMDRILGHFIVSRWVPNAIAIVKERLQKVDRQRRVLLGGPMPLQELMPRICAAWTAEVGRMLDSRPPSPPPLGGSEEAAEGGQVLAAAQRTHRAEQAAMALVPILATELHGRLVKGLDLLKAFTEPSDLIKHVEAPPQVSLLCRYPNFCKWIVSSIHEECLHLQGQAEDRARGCIRAWADEDDAFAQRGAQTGPRLWRIMVKNIGVDTLSRVQERLRAKGAQEEGGLLQLHPKYEEALQGLNRMEERLQDALQTLEGLRDRLSPDVAEMPDVFPEYVPDDETPSALPNSPLNPSAPSPLSEVTSYRRAQTEAVVMTSTPCG